MAARTCLSRSPARSDRLSVRAPCVRHSAIMSATSELRRPICHPGLARRVEWRGEKREKKNDSILSHSYSRCQAYIHALGSTLFILDVLSVIDEVWIRTIAILAVLESSLHFVFPCGDSFASLALLSNRQCYMSLDTRLKNYHHWGNVDFVGRLVQHNVESKRIQLQ